MYAFAGGVHLFFQHSAWTTTKQSFALALMLGVAFFLYRQQLTRRLAPTEADIIPRRTNMAVTIPANDRKAVWCIVVSFGIVLLTNALYPTPFNSLRFSVGTLIGLLLVGAPVALVLWAVWRGQYWAKVLVVLVTLYEFTRPLFRVAELQLPNYTLRLALLMLSLIPRSASTVLLARDLLRRPVTGEAGSHPIS